MYLKVVLLCLCILILTSPITEGRRGRGRGRTKSRVQIGLPITGKYRDPESDQYYNNNNVSEKLKKVMKFENQKLKPTFREPKFCRPLTLIMNMFWVTK